MLSELLLLLWSEHPPFPFKATLTTRMTSVWAARELAAGTTCAYSAGGSGVSGVQPMVGVISVLELTFNRDAGRSADAVRHFIIK